jgi:hypothetical protein
MEATNLDIPVLQPGEKVIGHAYVTEDGEIIFTPHSGAREVLLVEASSRTKGAWAVRQRPPMHAHVKAANVNASGEPLPR